MAHLLLMNNLPFGELLPKRTSSNLQVPQILAVGPCIVAVPLGAFQLPSLDVQHFVLQTTQLLATLLLYI